MSQKILSEKTFWKLCISSVFALSAAFCNSQALDTGNESSDMELLMLSTLGAVASGGQPSLAQRQRGIWIAGGFDGTSVINRTDLYDPETNTYFANAGGALNVPRSFLTLASMGGKVYAIGGVTSLGVTSQVVESLNPAQENPQWTTDTPLNSARANPTVEYIGGKLYAVGGSATAAPALNGTIEEFNGSSWNAAAYAALAAGDQRLDGCSATVNGVLFLNGGRNATTGWITANNGWVQAASSAATAQVTTVTEPAMSTTAGNDNERRWGCGGAGISNGAITPTVFIVGGNTATPATNSYPVSAAAITASKRFVSTYRTGQTAFSTKYDMLAARTFGRAVMIESGSNPGLYVFGGHDGSGPLSSSEYLPISGAAIGTFTARASMAVARYGFGATRVNP